MRRRQDAWPHVAPLAVALSLAFALFVLPIPASADEVDHLVATLEYDPSYKVRAMALRRLLRYALTPLADDTRSLRAIERAAVRDEHHVVRGIACVVLANLSGDDVRTTLEAATTDAHDFVRAQATKALAKLPPRVSATATATISRTETSSVAGSAK